ncbi:uncharacterized protein PV09_04245 [Verruconis gallopava]|uniref:DUF1682 domain-containing protein n=1 Tax=Verruconis gallopava TaxID=253628 RepID=A0A0D1XPK1_9PEZI|nr:uncharacterized protein PV09_04245 [Verruconis gallopava]KIW04486.1 hypothetical protein PV09_04245 [Verruconis gallopava]
MANIIGNIFGGKKPEAAAAPSRDAGGFADFAGVPDPSPASISPSLTSAVAGVGATARPAFQYTKWYRVWERTTVADFYTEMIILPFILLTILVHLWGTGSNRRRAKAWAKSFAPLIAQEYAVVGFGGRKPPTVDDVQAEGLVKSVTSDALVIPEEIIRENSPAEFVTYATGRTNVAFMDVKLTLIKRFNPLTILGENIIGFFFESMPATQETVEATAYAFDGKEKDLVPVPKGETLKVGGNSSYDGFVWAVVNKEVMKRMREERYDLSLTTTKEHPKLPTWASVMSENAEITETLLTADLAKAIEDAGDDFIALIVSDQPTDKPKTIDETLPRKRVTLQLKLSSYYPANTLSLFQYFLRLPDILVSQCHFRPEVMKRVKGIREDEIRKIKKASEEEEAEVRKEKADREKKEKRDKTLAALSAEEQRKFLEKEREKEQRRAQKKRTMRA